MESAKSHPDSLRKTNSKFYFSEKVLRKKPRTLSKKKSLATKIDSFALGKRVIYIILLKIRIIGELTDEVCYTLGRGEKIAMNYSNEGHLQLRTGSPDTIDLKPQTPIERVLDDGSTHLLLFARALCKFASGHAISETQLH